MYERVGFIVAIIVLIVFTAAVTLLRVASTSSTTLH